MTDTPITPESTAEFMARAAVAFRPSTNIDGWTGPRQKRFLEAIADGETVRDACGHVCLSPQSAYAFRRRPKGRAFDLGWKAADLLAREKIAADLLARATDGQTVEITRPDGSVVTKHSYDNRLAVQMLNRLDRYADASERTEPGHAARLVAGEFDAYLDLVGAEGGPARAGLFMLSRNEAPSDLEAVAALARADRALRCGTLAADVDVTDLDPARRAEWTAAQWARAEAAGLLVLAPPPAPPPAPAPAPAPAQPASTRQSVSTPEPEPIWFDEDKHAWRTWFAPPEEFAGDEDGEWGQTNYERDLAPEEMAVLGIPEPGGPEELAEARAERDAWFAANAAAPAQAAIAGANTEETLAPDDSDAADPSSDNED